MATQKEREERAELVDALEPYWRGLYDRATLEHADARIRVAREIQGIKDTPCIIVWDRIKHNIEFEIKLICKDRSACDMRHFPDGRCLYFRLMEGKCHAQEMWLRRRLAWIKGHRVDYIDFMSQKGPQELVTTDEYHRRLALRYPR